jgi:hypothetical protein
MAKNGGKKSAKLVGPLYGEGGTTNGTAAGPKGGTSPKDPLGYLSQSGQSAPSGSPSDRG